MNGKLENVITLGRAIELLETLGFYETAIELSGVRDFIEAAPTPEAAGRGEDLYFIQDARTYSGNSVFWWRPNGNGYTLDINEAWRVPKERALAQERSRPGVDKAWPVEAILAAKHGIRTTFDMQHLPKSAPPSGEQGGAQQ